MRGVAIGLIVGVLLYAMIAWLLASRGGTDSTGPR
jgi:hypothetical protein